MFLLTTLEKRFGTLEEIFCRYAVIALEIPRDHRFKLWHGAIPRSSHQQSPGLALQKAESRALLCKAAEGLQHSADTTSTSNMLFFSGFHWAQEFPHRFSIPFTEESIWLTLLSELPQVSTQHHQDINIGSSGHQTRIWPGKIKVPRIKSL